MKNVKNHMVNYKDILIVTEKFCGIAIMFHGLWDEYRIQVHVWLLELVIF